MLWLNETPGFVDIFNGGPKGRGIGIDTVNATFPPSDVDADLLNAFAPCHTNGVSNPTPVFKATMMPLPDFQTLSGNPSELTSVRLYCSSFAEVTILYPPAKLLEPWLYPPPTFAVYDWLLPPCMRSISQSIGSVNEYPIFSLTLFPDIILSARPSPFTSIKFSIFQSSFDGGMLREAEIEPFALLLDS